MQFYLASKSPRRHQLLKLIVEDFKVLETVVDETALPYETPEDLTIRLAQNKASSGLVKLKPQPENPIAVIGSDTVVALDDQIFGKPENKAEAISMMNRLSGRVHKVYSAVAVVADSYLEYRLSVTKLRFRSLSKEQIDRYCASDEPYDKAGGYGIQGAAGAFVSNLQGSYSGVMGLPLWHTQQLIHHCRQKLEP